MYVKKEGESKPGSAWRRRIERMRKREESERERERRKRERKKRKAEKGEEGRNSARVKAILLRTENALTVADCISSPRPPS